MATMQIPRLPITLRPEIGENVHGFLRRLAAANGHLNMTSFARAIGLEYKFGPISPDASWDRLAQATSLPVAELSTMRWTMADRTQSEAMVVVARTRVPRAFASPRSTRLCLSCIGETGIRRDFWSLTAVAACPRHRVLLTAECVCGRPLLPGLQGRVHECACGAILGSLKEVPAPSSVVRAACNLAARVGAASGYSCENDFASPFEELCAHDFMCLIHTLGVAAATPAEEDRPVAKATGAYGVLAGREVEPPLGVVLARLEGAVRVIDGWPDAYMSLLRSVEGRNTSADALTMSGAFATAVGRMLATPIRGADGLPFHLLRHAIDEYWDRRRRGKRKRRRRSLSTSDTVAMRLRERVNATILAKEVGAQRPTPFLSRTLRRAIELLGDHERDLEEDDLARLVTKKVLALYHASLVSLSSEAAKGVLEGGSQGMPLTGWDHPRLLSPDPAIHGLCLNDRPAYAPSAVEDALSRLRSVAQHVAQPDGLIPLVSEGMRGNLNAWYTKTDLLLDVFDGRLAVYTILDAPRLGDLLVHPGELGRASRQKKTADLLASEDFVPAEQANMVLEERFGVAGRLNSDEFSRLARSGLVRCSVDIRSGLNGKQRHNGRVYRLRDILKFVERRLQPQGLSVMEGEAFGRLNDIGPFIVALRRLGVPIAGVRRELALLGVKTPLGNALQGKMLRLVVDNAEKGVEVLALLTGISFSEGLVLPDSIGQRRNKVKLDRAATQ